MCESILTPKEVAALLRVSRQKIYELIKAGKLKAFRVGMEYRIKAVDLEDFIARHPAAKSGKPTKPINIRVGREQWASYGKPNAPDFRDDFLVARK